MTFENVMHIHSKGRIPLRRITALLLAALMLLACRAALAEADPALFVAEQLQALMEKDGKWLPLMLKDAAISQTAVEEGWEVTVTYVDPSAADGATLGEALASLSAPPTEAITVDVVEKDGAPAFGKKRNLRTVESAAKKTAAAAKKTYEAKESYDTDVRALMAGADSKKVKPNYWIRNLD